jgi:hypothetical protein
MRRRKLRWAVVWLALVAVGVLVPRPAPPVRATREKFGLVHKGMTLAEVTTILGPPGNYASGPTHLSGPASGRDLGPTGEAWSHYDWYSDTFDFWVEFDGSGVVIWRFDFDNHRIEKGPLDNLLWRAKRQWRKWFPEKPEGCP